MSKTIIILSGGFDPVHKGHIRMFKAAKEFPAKVVVGLNSDSWLIRKKEKPINRTMKNIFFNVKIFKNMIRNRT